MSIHFERAREVRRKFGSGSAAAERTSNGQADLVLFAPSPLGISVAVLIAHATV
jgi:hypothetical protein